eukprot:c9095_g1_i1.p1 GENE.c9095_g1_i1~~c9095_g1_i1.p1  ORF type:complete len:142 (-),score=27.67 c9095_g1_i1:71-496(-)
MGVPKKMSSGVVVPDSVVDLFNTMKIRKAHRILIISIQVPNVVVEKVVDTLPGNPDEQHAEFLNIMREYSNKSRIVVYDYHRSDTNTKLFLIKWSPDTAPGREKMILTSSAQPFQTKLEGAKPIQANDFDQIDADSLTRFF